MDQHHCYQCNLRIIQNLTLLRILFEDRQNGKEAIQKVEEQIQSKFYNLTELQIKNNCPILDTDNREIQRNLDVLVSKYGEEQEEEFDYEYPDENCQDTTSGRIYHKIRRKPDLMKEW